ncbi:MAG TPA: lipoyl synthase [Candidatus Eisenbacteria bacterium]|nr:lipoyl synthase [Candidatus Eisenbacteria bacterium]
MAGTGFAEPERRPDWLKVKLRDVNAISRMKPVLAGLHTVCESARCPNIGECWGRGTATFMILGNLCTRRCTFCAVPQGKPEEPDQGEPTRLAEAVHSLGLRHTVITSVTRDDLSDQGAAQFAACIREVRRLNPGCSVEVLIPDFQGDWNALDVVMQERPEVLNHNIETVPRLYRRVRPGAVYTRTLELLRRAHTYGTSKTKSGIMVGLGETSEEVVATLQDLRAHEVRIVTIGQYLKPRQQRIPMFRYVHPDEFAEYKRIALDLGFEHCESGPLVRSSYHAEEHVGASLK